MQGSRVPEMHLPSTLKNMQKSPGILKLSHIKTTATSFAGLSSFLMTVSKHPHVHYVHYSKKKTKTKTKMKSVLKAHKPI